MIKNKTYKIEDWKKWDAELDRATDNFHTDFGVWPNILIASEETHSKIDRQVNKKRDHVLPADAPTAAMEPPPWFEIAQVALRHCIVEIAVDNRVPDDRVALIYDSSPEFVQP